LPAHPGFEERFRLFARWLERLRGDPSAPAFCFDLGCGPGTLAIAAARLGYEVLGIDGSESMLALAAANSEREGVSVDFRCHTLPLADEARLEFGGRADVVVASSVIEYMPDEMDFLEMCRALLRPGGTALISFANARSLVRIAERRLRHTRVYRGSILEVQKHQQIAPAATGMLEQAGFMVLGVDYFSMPAPVYRLWRTPRRPPWLGTMFLVAAQRTASS
jgi:2-polyprenyl-3-methyl-5-hydroxy-6-metoxy-1,4-benzoquinol methylase